MPRFDKTCVTQFASTGCEKQLRFSLHPVTNKHQAERVALDLPHPQIRPALAEIRNAGNEWGDSKIHELAEAFGRPRLLGGASTPTVSAASPGLRFASCELLPLLRPGVPAECFLIEAEFDADTPTFRAAHGLDGLTAHGVGAPLEFARVRPDLIEVIAAGGPGASSHYVTPYGQLEEVPAGDDRCQLRIVDVKLTSEPGPHYFAELAYYTVSLAAWLQEHGLDGQYAVSSAPAVWPGSETDSALLKATNDGGTGVELYQAFHEDLETAPLRIFLADLARLLHDVLPRVLATPYADLPWAVTAGCQGCENLGQKFRDTPGAGPSDWDDRHCLPTAERIQDLSRLPFVSRGATRVLRKRGHHDVPAVAALPESDDTFDAHHRLRGQRSVVASRARALTGAPVAPLASRDATTAAIPRFAKLRLYVTADFDPGSAITLAFGLRWAWRDSGGQLRSVNRRRIHYVPGKTIQDEWPVFAALLDDIHALLAEAQGIDPRADVQVYVWDSVTLDHLTRVVGRHLGQIMANRNLNRLAWLFPPDAIMDAPHLAASPAVSVVRDAIKGLLTLDLPHTYTLIETARRYHDPSHPNPRFYVPRFWHDPFSDQIPPERAHQLWRGRMSPNAPTPTELQANLQQTVNSKLDALATITDRLGRDLHGRLTRKAPQIRQLHGPADLAGTSHLGLLLFAHAKLNAALDQLDVVRTRALAVAEREATFASARLTRRLTGTDEASALAMLGLTAQPHRAVYELAPGSREVKAKPGAFNWAIAPEAATGLLEQTFGTVIRTQRDGALDARWSGNWPALNLSMSKVLGVSVVDIDRDRRLLVVDFNDFGDATPLRQDLTNHGHVQLDHDLVLDPVAIDVFTKKVERTVAAIGNPPTATRDTRIQNALGISRNPRRGNVHPVEDFLWGAQATADAPVLRATAPLREALQAKGFQLNDSQWTAWQQALTRRLALIWGPPGTGKTATVRAILAALAHDSATAGQPLRIAVAAGTYTAVDNILQGLVPKIDEHWPDIAVRRLRSTGRAAPDWLTGPDKDVDSSDRTALQATATRLAGPHTTIVAGTTQQMYRLIEEATGVARQLFEVIIIDEAGQLDVASALLVLAGAAPNAAVVVAGDPKQLPPIHAASPPAGLEALVGSIYSFFRDWHAVPDSPLTINYRSNAEIVALARRAGYPPALTAHNPRLRIQYATTEIPRGTTPPPNWPHGLPYSPELADIADPERPVVCLTYPEGVSGQWNQFEADTVAALVWWYSTHQSGGLAGPGDDTAPAPIEAQQLWKSGIGVVTPHLAQRSRIVARLRDLFCTPGAHPDTASWIAEAVDTVERFQGQERDIIIASYAVGDPDTVAEEAEFLHDLNRFNVLATRSKAKLIVIASRELVAHISGDLEVIRSSELLKDFVDTFCTQNQRVMLGWSDQGVHRPVEVELRWH
ncbi:DEAD/DEAH box helicase [Micromonospora orduensis]|uniref:DEAD/DEAH box helicase n=1 Tax=Micromonospora orduensis TaxID=1420891 RepID=UPI0038242E8A